MVRNIAWQKPKRLRSSERLGNGLGSGRKRLREALNGSEIIWERPKNVQGTLNPMVRAQGLGSYLSSRSGTPVACAGTEPVHETELLRSDCRTVAHAPELAGGVAPCTLAAGYRSARSLKFRV